MTAAPRSDRDFAECRGGPLLFFERRYRAAAPVPPAATTEVVDTLLAWPGHIDWI